MSLFAITTTLAILAQSVAAVPHLVPRDVSCPGSDKSTFNSPNGVAFRIECGIDRWGGDMPAPNGQKTITLDACIALCAARSGCVSVQWADKSACYLKNKVNNPYAKENVWGAVAVEKTSAPAPSAPAVPAVSAPVIKGANIRTTSNTPVATSTAVIVPSTAPSTPSTVPSTPSTGGGSCAKAKSLNSKRGLCYNDPALTSLFGDKISWGYNWGQTSGSIRSNVLYSPMLWGKDHVSSWSASAKSAIAAGSDTLLAFNEPDLGEQSNMDVNTAVSLYKQYMQPFACQARLSAPAVTNGGAPLGLTYLKNFISACSGCTIDVVPIHWYDSATNVAYFKSYIQDAYAAGGNRPLWITEFGASGSDAQVTTFLQTVLPWLDAQPYVERYAYFMASKGLLVNSGGNGLSAIGQAYNSV